jgi:glycosyltransferase involved in cell wall biosynthesis
MSNKILVYDKNGDHIGPWLSGLMGYLVSKGLEPVAIMGVHPDKYWEDTIHEYRHVFLWNGTEDAYLPVRRICKEKGVGYHICECAWFPQSKYWYCDTEGINASSSLMRDDLNWVGDEQFDKLDAIRKAHIGERRWNYPGDYILVPLQLDWDTNIIQHSPIKDMQFFIDHAEERFKGERIIVKKHPKDTKKYTTKDAEFVDSGSFLDYAQNAKLVYCLTTTCLYEAALMGVPVKVIGDGYFRAHPDEWQKTLAAMADRQIPVDSSDLDYWFEDVLFPKSKNRVSVVIPCYNQAQYLKRAVGSVLNQTVNAEIVIVNDGSPDNTEEVCNELRKKHPDIVYVSQDNKGLPGARNTGFRNSNCDIVFTLDADDALGSEDVLEKCLDRMGDDVGVVYLDLKKLSDGKMTSFSLDLARLKKENTIASCALIRKSVWESVGGYWEELHEGYEDWEFWVSCVEHGVKFEKCSGVWVSVDDTHEGRMTPYVQEADNYWRLLGKISNRHPKFWNIKVPVDKKEDKYLDGVSVVLSSYNQRDTIEMALEAMYFQEDLPVEVIIADDGSTDGTLEWIDSVASKYPFPVRYITRKHTWYRLASLNNLAARHTKGKRILFTNGDQVHCPGSIGSHYELDDNTVGGGVFKGVAEPYSREVDLQMVREWGRLEELATEHPSTKTNVGYIESTDPNINPIGVWGGNISVPAAIFEKIGGYDEGFDVGWGGEENNLVRCCTEKGATVKWVMGSYIYHLDHPLKAYSLSQLGSKRYLKMVNGT